MKTKFLTILLFAGSSILAADRHVLPEGTGRMDGTSWSNAFGAAGLKNLDGEFLKPGDRLLIGSGDYRDVSLTVACPGTDGAPVTITGVDRGAGLPRLVSSWKIERPDKGPSAVTIEPGVEFVTVRDLRIEKYQIGIMAKKSGESGTRRHLNFENIQVRLARHGFYLSDCDDLSLVDCEVKRYSKHAFRFDQGCDRAKVQRCTADCSEGDLKWEEQTEALPFGFTLNSAGSPNTAFLFEDCLAQNNLMPKQTGKYKNGDGFVVEENARDVTFLRCRALRNQDGGFDLKVDQVQLTGCVAIGNGRNFRIWNSGALTNCFSGWSKTGLWCNGGPVLVSRSTFYDLSSEAVLTDDSADAPVTLKDCLLAKVKETSRRTAKGSVEVDTSNVVNPTPDGFDGASGDWDGLGDAMGSRLFPQKGYRHE